MTQGKVIKFPAVRRLGIQSMRVRRDDVSGEILIDIRAFGGFAPRLLERIPVQLVVHEKMSDSGTKINPVEVPGRVTYRLPTHSRGTHFIFVFVPESSHALSGIVFHGLNQFSNIRSMNFSDDGVIYHIVNRFYRHPAWTLE